MISQLQVTNDMRLSSLNDMKIIDLKNCDINEIKKYIRIMITGMHFIAQRFKPGLKLYRGRRFSKKPSNISELSYPQPQYIKNYQRVNCPGDPYFYCSLAREVPFFELDVIKGEYLALSTWITKTKLILNNIGYAKELFKSLHSKREESEIEKTRNNCKISDIDDKIYKYLSTEFMKKVKVGYEYEYKTSIAIAECLLYSESKDAFNLDGLLYPTIMMRGNADNVVLNRNYLTQENVELKKVEFIRIDEIKEFSYKVKTIDFATEFTSDGRILWKGRTPHWIIRENGGILKVEFKNGNFFAYDKYGNPVEKE